MQNFMLNLLKKILKNQIFQKIVIPWKFLVWPSAAIYFFFRFLQIWKTKTGRFEAEESAVTGEKFLIISNEKILEPIEKTSYWSASVYNTILVITVI